MNRIITNRRITACAIILGTVFVPLVAGAQWAAPTQTAPDGNVSSPLNTGNTAQSKISGLLLNTGGAANGLIVQYGNVGIGSTTPSEKLVVNGNAHFGTGTGGSKIYMDGNSYADSSHPTIQVTNGNTMSFRLPGGNSGTGAAYYFLRHDGASFMTILNNLNVGIGTTSPTNLLSVAGSSVGSAQAVLRSTASNVSSALEFADNASPQNRWWIGSGLSSGSDGKFFVYDARQAASRLVIDTSGNIGIGTTNPSYNLHVAGGFNPLGIERNNLTAQNNEWKFAITSDPTSAGATLSDRSLSIVPVDYDADFAIYTDKDTATAPAFLIKSNNGNVGIGTTAPGAKLEVAGQVKITGGTPGAGKVLTSDAAGLASWTTPATGSVGGSGTANYVPKWTAGSTLGSSLIYDNGTNAGVGTSDPGTKFEVAAGSLAVSAQGDAVLYLHTDDTSAFNKRYKTGIAATGGGSWGQGDLSFFLNNAANNNNAVISTDTKMIIKAATGNVGIGVSNPTTKLDVGGNVKMSGVMFGNNGDALSPYLGYGNIPGIASSWVFGDSIHYNFAINANGGIAVGDTYARSSTPPANGAIINGNVGIGVSNPTTKLDVGGSIRLAPGESATPMTNLALFTNLGYWGIRQDTSHNFNIDVYNAASPKAAFTIDQNNANVGISTTTPAVKLDVYGQIRATNPNRPTCTAALRGAIQYDVSDDHFYGCRATGWAQLDN